MDRLDLKLDVNLNKLDRKFDLLMEKLDNFQNNEHTPMRSRKSSAGSPLAAAEPNISKYFGMWRKRSSSTDPSTLSEREKNPSWFLSAPVSGDLLYCPLPGLNLKSRPVSPGADICDRYTVPRVIT